MNISEARNLMLEQQQRDNQLLAEKQESEKRRLAARLADRPNRVAIAISKIDDAIKYGIKNHLRSLVISNVHSFTDEGDEEATVKELIRLGFAVRKVKVLVNNQGMRNMFSDEDVNEPDKFEMKYVMYW